MFIQEAYADVVNGSASQVVATGGVGFGSLWVFVFIFAIMYFLIIRPQKIQYKKQEEMLKAIKTGDKVITAGGIVAKVKKAVPDKEEISVEIADGIVVEVLRSTISQVIHPEVKSEKKKK